MVSNLLGVKNSSSILKAAKRIGMNLKLKFGEILCLWEKLQCLRINSGGIPRSHI